MRLLAESGGNSSKLCFGKRTDEVITILQNQLTDRAIRCRISLSVSHDNNGLQQRAKIVLFVNNDH